jgi:hypothetical protein
VKRKKALQWALLGVLALSATAGATSASASGIIFEQYPATMEAAELGTHTFVFSGREVQCSFSGMTGTAAGPTETVAATVSPNTCSSPTESEMSLKMNGCQFILHPNVGKGTFDIGPPGCGSMVLTGSNCTRSFPAQTGLTATFENQGSGKSSTVKFTENASLKYTVTKGGLILCGPSENSASYAGAWNIAGQTAGVPNGAQVVSQLPVGFFLSGKESTEEASQPKFSAEGYPTKLTGEQDPAHKQVLTLSGRSVECGEVNLSSEVGAASSLLSLNSESKECVATVLGSKLHAAVRMNSCHYGLHALNVGPPYAGSLDISCSKEGDGIQVDVYNYAPGEGEETEANRVCSYVLSPQSGLKGIGLSNSGEGSLRKVAVSYALGGIAYTRQVGTTAPCGSKTSTASYAGNATLRGVK